MKYIISYDLGTGGTKASIFDENGVSIVSMFEPCDTFFPQSSWHEQKPQDWWSSVEVSTKKMLAKTSVNPADIVALAVSGHSLGVVPIAEDGALLAEQTPIWSDSRATEQANLFFEKIHNDDWYLTTGSGFPSPLYSIFKIMWYKQNCPEVYSKTAKFIGTKDYINYLMTGILATDNSYASGSGVYSLERGVYVDEYITAAGIDKSKLPEIFPSTHVLGTVEPKIAEQLGLSSQTKVICGGVDNACMALGAGCTAEGEAYTSLGTSAWVAVSSDKPIVSTKTHPYVFAHCIPHAYVSAVAIFSAGNSYRWARDTLCTDLVKAEENGGTDAYIVMDKLASESPVGSNMLIFNPTLAGGSGLDDSPNARGGFIGLQLRHNRADMLRSVLEGVCMNLRLAMDAMDEQVKLSNKMLIVGGGGKSKFWRGLFAGIYGKAIVETNVGQDAGSLGAAALAAVGSGLWADFERIKAIHQVKNVVEPPSEDAAVYEKIMPVFKKISQLQSVSGDLLSTFEK